MARRSPPRRMTPRASCSSGSAGSSAPPCRSSPPSTCTPTSPTAWCRKLTSLDDAVAKALATGRDRSLPALCFADVADNPGGGGRGNTMFLLRALHEAGVAGALIGIIYDPPLAAEAHQYGVGYHFEAHF